MIDKSTLDHCRVSIPEKYLNDNQLTLLAENSKNNEHIITIIRLLYQDSKERPIGITGCSHLINVVNNSNYNLREWIAAIFEFDHWLNSNNRKSTFLKMIGFLQCCEESPENKNIKQKLSVLLNNMLNEFGFIG